MCKIMAGLALVLGFSTRRPRHPLRCARWLRHPPLCSEQLGSESRNRSTTTPLVIDRRCTVDLAKKAKSLPANREHTQEHKGMQPNCR
jgi:hypothetical protein